MKVITYKCDGCQKVETHPMALFKNGTTLEWRLNEDPANADYHACSKECATKIAQSIPQSRNLLGSMLEEQLASDGSGKQLG